MVSWGTVRSGKCPMKNYPWENCLLEKFPIVDLSEYYIIVYEIFDNKDQKKSFSPRDVSQSQTY